MEYDWKVDEPHCYKCGSPKITQALVLDGAERALCQRCYGEIKQEVSDSVYGSVPTPKRRLNGNGNRKQSTTELMAASRRRIGPVL